MDNNNFNITFWDLGVKGTRTVPENMISLAWSSTQKRIVLNKGLSERLRDGNYAYLRVGSTGISNEVYFVFCKKQTPDSLVLELDHRRVFINSKYICEQLIDTLGLTKKSQHLRLSGNLSNSPEYLTFKVSKQ